MLSRRRIPPIAWFERDSTRRRLRSSPARARLAIPILVSRGRCSSRLVDAPRPCVHRPEHHERLARPRRRRRRGRQHDRLGDRGRAVSSTAPGRRVDRLHGAFDPGHRLVCGRSARSRFRSDKDDRLVRLAAGARLCAFDRRHLGSTIDRAGVGGLHARKLGPDADSDRARASRSCGSRPSRARRHPRERRRGRGRRVRVRLQLGVRPSGPQSRTGRAVIGATAGIASWRRSTRSCCHAKSAATGLRIAR